MKNTNQFEVDRLPKKLTAVQSYVKDLKIKLTKKLAKKGMFENFGEKEYRALNDFVGSDIYARIGGTQVFVSEVVCFDNFIQSF